MNIYDLIKSRSNQWLNQPAIHDKYGALSFKQLFTETESCAEQLKSSGLNPVMGLGIISGNCREFIILILAGLRCGAVVMPISDQLTETELNKATEQAGLHAIVSFSDSKGRKQLQINSTPFFFEQIKHGEHPIAPHIPNPAFIRFTSGTTSQSKGVVISHQSVQERLEAANKGLKLGQNDAVVWVLPIAYHFVVSIMLYLYFGAAIILCENFLAETIATYTKRFRGTLLYASPMHIRLLASGKESVILPTLKHVISTSAGLPNTLCVQFKKKFNLPVSQAFGIIEVGLPIINYDRSAEHPEAVGYTLPDFEVGILNENLEELPDGEIGHLALKGPGIFDGYLEPPTTRDEILQNGWFLTGDLASKSPDGLVTIRGRQKSMINISGNKVFPEEVEAVLNEHPQVESSRVFGGQHRLTGEIVEAEIVTQQDLLAEEIISFCRKRLSSFKIPQRIHFVERLEMTESGKVRRN